MNILEIIEAKKQGRELDSAQIKFLVAGFTDGTIPEYQMAAFLMATWFRGMTSDETAELTGAMLRSGDQLDTTGLGAPSADKHSTGGVGTFPSAQTAMATKSRSPSATALNTAARSAQMERPKLAFSTLVPR